MKFRRKKVTKQRGSKTYGWGSMKKHRGAGNRGGRGMAGTGKRADTKKPTIINIYGNKYFGKKGFTKHNKRILKPITLSRIQLLIDNGKIKKSGASFKINLKDLGCNKLLGSGIINSQIEVETLYASKRAIEKVEKAGGKVKLEQAEEQVTEAEHKQQPNDNK